VAPLLTVETEVTQRVQMKWVLPIPKRIDRRILPWLVRWAYRTGTRVFCSALAALVGLAQNIFFLTIHFFNSFVPIAQQTGQAAVLGRLSRSVSLVSTHILYFQLFEPV
jgi:hypothetical protein